MAQERGSHQPELEDLEKTQELNTEDLMQERKEEVTQDVTRDVESNPVRTRFDSSQWITSW